MSNINDALGISPNTLPDAAHNGAVSSFLSRYADGYDAAAFIVGFGTVIKVISIIAGVLVAIAGLVASSNQYGSSSGTTMFVGAIFGALIAFGGFVAGIMVSAQGQVLKAVLDTAVNTSPFLENQERTRIMGL